MVMTLPADDVSSRMLRMSSSMSPSRRRRGSASSSTAPILELPTKNSPSHHGASGTTSTFPSRSPRNATPSRIEQQRREQQSQTVGREQERREQQHQAKREQQQYPAGDKKEHNTVATATIEDNSSHEAPDLIGAAAAATTEPSPANPFNGTDIPGEGIIGPDDVEYSTADTTDADPIETVKSTYDVDSTCLENKSIEHDCTGTDSESERIEDEHIERIGSTTGKQYVLTHFFVFSTIARH